MNLTKLHKRCLRAAEKSAVDPKQPGMFDSEPQGVNACMQLVAVGLLDEIFTANGPVYNITLNGIRALEDLK